MGGAPSLQGARVGSWKWEGAEEIAEEFCLPLPLCSDYPSLLLEKSED